MDIIKDPTTRTIAFKENGAVIQTLQESVTANLNRNRNGIVLEDITGRKIEIYTKQIDETQKLPNPPIKFQPGTTVDLWDLLFDPSTTPFFDELHIRFASSGGNTVDETNVKIVPGPTYTVLATDYILWVTANCTITLPVIIASRIAYPIRIFSRGVLVTVLPSGGALINGKTSVKLNKYEMFTFRPGTLTDWGLGD